MFRKLRKTISVVILAAFISTSIKSPAYAQMVDPMPRMPIPGTMVHLSPEFTPAYLKGIVIHPENALKFDFIVYKGDKPLTDAQKRIEYTKLTKYFLASLAIPDDDQWVNLSPYEKNRIIKDDFGKTEMGRDLLSQDYLLKQITASLIYPENNLGKKFWDKVYAQAQEQFGTTDVPINTFNKVWILPDDALIYEKGNTAYVLRNHLRVMLEEDYLSLKKHSAISEPPLSYKEGDRGSSKNINALGSKIVKEIILPELQKEVNEGRNFAALRQVYSGMLLATWYKHALKESLLSKIYADKAKVKGVDQDPKTNEQIYRQYLKAYKKGVFNFIKEDVDKYTNETIPRKYFSGGTEDYAMAFKDLGRNPIEIEHSLDNAQATQVKTEVESTQYDLAQVAAEEQGVADAVHVNSDAAMTTTFLDSPKIIGAAAEAWKKILLNDRMLRAYRSDIRGLDGLGLEIFYKIYRSIGTGEDLNTILTDPGYSPITSARKIFIRNLAFDIWEWKKTLNDSAMTANSIGTAVRVGAGITQAISKDAIGDFKRIGVHAVVLDIDDPQVDDKIKKLRKAGIVPLLPGDAQNSEKILKKLSAGSMSRYVPVTFVDGLEQFRKAIEIVLKIKDQKRAVNPKGYYVGVTLPKNEMPEAIELWDSVTDPGKIKVVFIVQESKVIETNLIISNTQLQKRMQELNRTTGRPDEAMTTIIPLSSWIPIHRNSLQRFTLDSRPMLAMIRAWDETYKIAHLNRQNAHAVLTELVKFNSRPLLEFQQELERGKANGNGASMIALQLLDASIKAGAGKLSETGLHEDYVRGSIDQFTRLLWETGYLSDNAMNVPVKHARLDNNKNPLGGIDFNSANLNLQIKRDGQGVPLPISQQDLQNIKIDGLVPVILNIKPAAVSPLLSDLQV